MDVESESSNQSNRKSECIILVVSIGVAVPLILLSIVVAVNIILSPVTIPPPYIDFTLQSNSPFPILFDWAAPPPTTTTTNPKINTLSYDVSQNQDWELILNVSNPDAKYNLSYSDFRSLIFYNDNLIGSATIPDFNQSGNSKVYQAFSFAGLSSAAVDRSFVLSLLGEWGMNSSSVFAIEFSGKAAVFHKGKRDERPLRACCRLDVRYSSDHINGTLPKSTSSAIVTPLNSIAVLSNVTDVCSYLRKPPERQSMDPFWFVLLGLLFGFLLVKK